MAEIRGIFDYIREALGEQISPIGSAYSKFLELPVDARRGLISEDFRQKVENMPTAPYTGGGNFQGVLGSTEAEKINAYSGSDLTDYDISGENISNADKFVAESILGTGDILTQPDVIGKELVDIGSGLLQKATGEVTNQEQVDKANVVQDSIASLFTPEGFNKSMYETGGAVALPVGGAYLGVKGAQLSKGLFDKGIQPGLSIKDISARKQGEITAPIDEYGFYDPIEQLLMDLPQEVNTRGDIKRYLLKRGIKRDQILESKIDDYMFEREFRSQKITKEGLLNQINKNKTALVETSLMGSQYEPRIRLDRPEYDWSEDTNYMKNPEQRNPEGRNYEVLDDPEYIQSIADDWIYEWEDLTVPEVINELKNYGKLDQFLIKALNKKYPEKYPLTKDELKEISGYSNVTPKWVDEMKDQKFDSEVIENIAQYKAETDYWNNPYMEWKIKTTDGDEYKVLGNEELGLQIYRPNGDEVNQGDPIYSLDEAEVQINQDAIDYGYLGYADGNTQYENYVGAARDDLNMDTYEEVLVTAPHLGDDFYGDHFSDYANTTAHIRMADTLDGKRKKVIEIQSDLHQKGRQTNYYTEEFKDKQREKFKLLPDLEKEYNKYNDDFNAKKDEWFRNQTMLDDYARANKMNVLTGTLDDRGITVVQGGIYLRFSDGKLQRVFDSEDRTITSNKQLEELSKAEDSLIDLNSNPFEGDWKLSSPDDLPPIKENWKYVFDNAKEDYKLFTDYSESMDKKMELGKQINDIKYPDYVPDAPQKNERWVQDAVQRAINKARQEGKEGVEFVDSEYSLDIWNPNRTKNEDGKVRYQELYQNVYDKKVPSVLKKYKNKYGGEVEKLEGGGYYYKFDDKSRNVKGIPLASTGGLLSIDQMQDDDKMNNKQGLLA